LEKQRSIIKGMLNQLEVTLVASQTDELRKETKQV